jgi:hypothetical protein
MSTLVRLPHGLMRRYLSFLERIIVAAGLAGLVFGLVSSLPVYPPNWDLVILATVFVVALWWPGVAYFIAVAAVAYPLYTLSLYIAVLFLAVALLGQRVFIHNMGAMVLVLATPWLARYNLAWMVPLLGGLWWGAAGGAWMGGLAALWGQVLAGMAGLSPDWLALIGSSPTVVGVAQRFGEANSLETLKLILEPLAPGSTLLLYHLLQVIAWAAVGGIVGFLADRTWVQRRRPWGTIIVGVAGAFALLGAHLGLGAWLEQSWRVCWKDCAISWSIHCHLVPGASRPGAPTQAAWTCAGRAAVPVGATMGKMVTQVEPPCLCPLSFPIGSRLTNLKT